MAPPAAAAHAQQLDENVAGLLVPPRLCLWTVVRQVRWEKEEDPLGGASHHQKIVTA